MNNSIRKAVYLILILMAAFSVFQGARNALRFSQDFQYDAALALRSGINPYKESLEPSGILATGPTADFYRIFEEAGAPQKMEANQFPSLLMLLFPITYIPYVYARILWLILNLIFTGLIIVLLRQTLLRDIDGFYFNVLMLLMIAGTPWRNQIGVGQHSLFSFFFFLLALWLSEMGSGILSGLALSVSYFKYTLTAPLALYFLYKKRYREFVISLIPHFIGTFVAAGILGSGFIDMIKEPLKVSSALTGEGSIDVGALTGGAGWSVIITLVIMLGLTVLSFILPEGKDKAYFSLLIFMSLVMTYHRVYDFFMLIPAAAGVIAAVPSKGMTGKRILTAAYALIVFYFFFVLRIFSESSASLAVGAVLYYAFLVYYTVFQARFAALNETYPAKDIGDSNAG